MLYATVRQRKIHVKNPTTVIQNGIGVDKLMLSMDEEWLDMDSIVCVFTTKYMVEEEKKKEEIETEEEQAATTGQEGETEGESTEEEPVTIMVEKEIVKEMLLTFGEPVLVPWENLTETGTLSVSCTGYVGEEKVMTTMLPDSFWNVVQNGPKTGEAVTEPTPSLYDQIIAVTGKAQTAAKLANDVTVELRTAKENGDFNGSDGVTPAIKIGNVLTGVPGGKAQVTASGTPTDVILNFVIPTGAQGTPGIPGSPGTPGRDGKDGKDGAIGPIGPQGPKGDAGPQGPQGQQGIQGDKGDPGDSGVYLGSEEPTDPNVKVWIDPEGEADESAGTEVTAETIKAALGYTPADDSDVAALSDEKLDKKELTTAIDDALLKAKESGVFDGAQGPQGEKGEKGDKGETGEQGIQGIKGDKGDTGAQGPQGEPGEAGYTPIKGIDYYTPAEKAEIVTDVKNAIGAVPEYWMEELTAGIEAINTKLCAAGKNKAAFLFYTDAHWNDGSQMSPTLLKYLHRHTGMNKTFFGGDIVSSEADDYDTMSYLWDWREQLKDLPNHHSVPGNHDDGNEINKRFDPKYMYGYLLAAEETPDVVNGANGLYYYIDSPAEKTRYLFLDTSQFVVDDEQKAFVTNALMTTPENWHIVAIAHIWVDADYKVTPPVPADINASAQELLTMFDNYNARSGVYAECTGWVEFCIGGHTHWDYDTTSETGIPIVLVETDSANVRSGLGFTAGTTTEASVNGIVADYDAKKIYVVRVGRGESREITVTTTIVTYTNQLPFALGFDGTILDGVGYKEDARLASTELGFRTATGYDCSGMIEAKQGDRVYLKNITWWNDTSDTTNYLLVSYRAEDFSSINQTYIVNIVGNSDFNATTDENGNVTSFMIPSWSSIAAIKYIMICAQDINSNSIITVNEPIE